MHHLADIITKVTTKYHFSGPIPNDSHRPQVRVKKTLSYPNSMFLAAHTWLTQLHTYADTPNINACCNHLNLYVHEYDIAVDLQKYAIISLYVKFPLTFHNFGRIIVYLIQLSYLLFHFAWDLIQIFVSAHNRTLLQNLTPRILQKLDHSNLLYR